MEKSWVQKENSTGVVIQVFALFKVGKRQVDSHFILTGVMKTYLSEQSLQPAIKPLKGSLSIDNEKHPTEGQMCFQWENS